MPVDPRTPCIIGAARRTWRDRPVPEPLLLWEEVARAAAADAGCPSALADLQSLQVVYCQSWQYDRPCDRLAERLGARPAQRGYSGLGGSVPLRLTADAASSMADGGPDLALVVGGEALATLRHHPDPAWSFPPDEPRPFPITLDRLEAAHGIYQAYLTFALLDTARRIHRAQGIDSYRTGLGELLAPLSSVAAAQPEHAWFPVAHDPEEIIRPTAANRMVATPYTKLMTAVMDVDMAAGVLVATEARADSLGVPTDRRVYLWGSGTAEEPAAMASRPDLWRSPAMASAMAQALGTLTIDDVAHLDLYSCFGASLQFARDALGIGDDRALTVTGGLPYHGGPGSNYATHALAAMVEALRGDPGARGLVTGVGMHMTSHAATVWSATPPPSPPTGPSAPSPVADGVPVTAGAEGPATVATFSTTYGREGPEWTALICDLPDGSRCYARLDEPAGAEDELAGEPVTLEAGRRGVSTARR
ncbi:MAG: acetyl-CoA synthetase [Acidimicrobiales bacterium]